MEVGLVLWVVSGQSSCLCLYVVQFKAFPGSARISQSRWFSARGFLGGWPDIYGLASPSCFWPLPNSSGWLQLVSSVFLIGTSCCEIIHASWPGQVFSVNGSLTTLPHRETSYSGYFLGIGAEVSFFCNYFLLEVGAILASRVEVSLYLI